ncbi:MAG: ATP-binding protein, partial [Erysipelothrix sp.]
MSEKNYSASSIEILEGLEAVRKRPGMYIGSTDQRGLHHLVWEVMDNAIDEALNGFGSKIKLVIEDDLTISVRDEGRGMPIEKHPSGVSALQVIFTVLHAGGKFSQSGGYKTSGGLHGVGASVVNALSEFVDVKVFTKNQTYMMHFSNGGKDVSSLEKIDEKGPIGSWVRFRADESIFKNCKFSYDTICERVQESAFLLQGISFEVVDLRVDAQKTFLYEDGLNAFMSYIHEDQTVLNDAIVLQGEDQEIEARVALQYNEGYN